MNPPTDSKQGRSDAFLGKFAQKNEVFGILYVYGSYMEYLYVLRGY